MNSHLLNYEREFFLLRIITGSLPYGKLEIRQPNIYILQRASQIYSLTYKRCLKKDIYTDKDAVEDMIIGGLWTEEDQEALEILPERIESHKVQMFENILRPTYQDKIRIHLNSCKDQYNSLLQRRHKFDYLTCEGIAHFAKWQHIISNSTYQGKKRWKWATGNKYDALDFYYKHMITEEQIRDLCKSQPWSSYWSSREACGSLFSRPSSELTQDQVRLIYWSSLYDQVYEQTENDPEKLTEDNDVFDGWLIHKSRVRKAEQKAHFIKNPKIANAQNIFIAAKDKAEAREIQNMNTGRAKQTFLDRIKRIKQEGTVAHKDFADVQLSRYEK